MNVILFLWLAIFGSWGTIDTADHLARYAIRNWTVRCPHAAPCKTEPEPAAAPAALTPDEADRLAGLDLWATAHPHSDVVRANGSWIADQLRITVPEVSDAYLGRVLLALTNEAGNYTSRTVFADAIAAAAVNLTFLERTDAL